MNTSYSSENSVGDNRVTIAVIPPWCLTFHRSLLYLHYRSVKHFTIFYYFVSPEKYVEIPSSYHVQSFRRTLRRSMMGRLNLMLISKVSQRQGTCRSLEFPYIYSFFVHKLNLHMTTLFSVLKQYSLSFQIH